MNRKIVKHRKHIVFLLYQLYFSLDNKHISSELRNGINPEIFNAITQLNQNSVVGYIQAKITRERISELLRGLSNDEISGGVWTYGLYQMVPFYMILKK